MLDISTEEVGLSGIDLQDEIASWQETAMCWNAEQSHFLPSSSCSGAPSLSLRAQLEQEQEHWDPQLQSD